MACSKATFPLHIYQEELKQSNEYLFRRCVLPTPASPTRTTDRSEKESKRPTFVEVIVISTVAVVHCFPISQFKNLKYTFITIIMIKE